MSITRKGSRLLIVDGVRYRWMIRKHPTYSQGLAWQNMCFAVALADNSASVLHATTDSARPDNWLVGSNLAVTPALVAQAIQLALQQGWMPTQRGATHRMHVVMSGEKQTDIET